MLTPNWVLANCVCPVLFIIEKSWKNLKLEAILCCADTYMMWI